MSLDKYLDCRSSLEAYSWMGNVTLDNNLDLNLYIVLKLKTIDLISFLFFFIYFLFLDLGLGVSVMSHMAVTNCYTSVTYYKRT